MAQDTLDFMLEEAVLSTGPSPAITWHGEVPSMELLKMPWFVPVRGSPAPTGLIPKNLGVVSSDRNEIKSIFN